MIPAVTSSNRSTMSVSSCRVIVRLREVYPTMSANPTTMGEASTSPESVRSSRLAALTRWRRHTYACTFSPSGTTFSSSARSPAAISSSDPEAMEPRKARTCHSASRAKVRPIVRMNACSVSGSMMPSSTSSWVSPRASTSAWVKAASPSSASGKPSARQRCFAMSGSTPDSSETSARVSCGDSPSISSVIAWMTTDESSGSASVIRCWPRVASSPWPRMPRGSPGSTRTARALLRA